MGAKQKLNQSYLNGSLILALLIGLATESWLIFFGSLAGLLISNLVFKEIRFREQ